jgi:thioredoxin-related protein
MIVLYCLKVPHNIKHGLFLLLTLFLSQALYATEIEIGDPGFDDTVLDEPIKKPDWFKLSFLDIKEDLDEAKEGGKKGLILYFGMERCPYCKALLEVNFAKPDIKTYTQENFDVVAIDVRGSRSVTLVTGETMTENEFAVHRKANFTPTLVFYDLAGKEVHRMVGYYAPYTFSAALEYVADRHYQKETFRSYLARAENPDRIDEDSLNYLPFAMNRPYILARKQIRAQRPLMVIFEQASCHACDVLHADAFSTAILVGQMYKFDIVQLDMWSEEPVIDVNGKKSTARAWADSLGIFYTPTLVFYDESGSEVLRLASVAHFNRLRNVIKYVTTGGYKKYKNLAEWNSRN